MLAVRPARILVVFALGIIGGLAGESLLVLQRHCGGFERGLIDDFRVLAFLKKDDDASRLKVLEEILRALPDVEDARYVSRQEALARLRREAPDLADSVTWIGENPLAPAYELRLGAGAFSRFPQWLEAASATADWADFRYKQAQVRAILQARFYGHFIALALNAVLCAAALAMLAFLWSAGSELGPDASRTPPDIERGTALCFIWSRVRWLAALAAVFGAAVGMGLSALMTLPMREFFPWWSLPLSSSHALLLGCVATLGWALPVDPCSAGD